MSELERSTLERSRIAVEGVAMGDAFGEKFFADPQAARVDPEQRELPEGPWRYTDDTAMALGIHEMFAECEAVDEDRLAEIFAERYADEPWRGYGANAQRILRGIAEGRDWSALSEGSFGGEGSFGNGAAMRVAPVGAYYADDLEAATGAADRTAQVTHSHEEGRAGAVAVSVAAAVARRTRDDEPERAREAVFEAVLDRTPSGDTREGLVAASEIDPETGAPAVAERLGSGQRVTAMDTVPFVVWCAARWCDDLEEALWRTVSGLGDCDTTCAMVGGIVSQRTGLDDLDDTWFRRRENLEWRTDAEERR